MSDWESTNWKHHMSENEIYRNLSVYGFLYAHIYRFQLIIKLCVLDLFWFEYLVCVCVCFAFIIYTVFTVVVLRHSRTNSIAKRKMRPIRFVYLSIFTTNQALRLLLWMLLWKYLYFMKAITKSLYLVLSIQVLLIFTYRYI